MNADKVSALARATLDGSMPFPEIVGKLIAEAVERYQVDFAASTFAFYSAAGSFVRAPLPMEGLPMISDSFDAPALKSAILDSQEHGQKFRQFCDRAVRACVQGYMVFLNGQRVIYFGRQGDQHVEGFPGAKPTDA